MFAFFAKDMLQAAGILAIAWGDHEMRKLTPEGKEAIEEEFRKYWLQFQAKEFSPEEGVRALISKIHEKIGEEICSVIVGDDIVSAWDLLPFISGTKIVTNPLEASAVKAVCIPRVSRLSLVNREDIIEALSRLFSSTEELVA